MKKLMLALLAAILLALTVVVWAQTAPRVYWDHDGINVTEFKCQIDSGDLVSLGLPTPSGTTYSATLSSCGTLAVGAHLLYVYACNALGCETSTGIYVVKL